jgi:hypothetical protein
MGDVHQAVEERGGVHQAGEGRRGSVHQGERAAGGVRAQARVLRLSSPYSRADEPMAG